MQIIEERSRSGINIKTFTRRVAETYRNTFGSLEIFLKISLNDSSDKHSFLAIQDSQVVGGYKLTKRSPYAVSLSDFIVLPDFQGSGIGSKLLQHSVEMTRTLHESYIQDKNKT